MDFQCFLKKSFIRKILFLEKIHFNWTLHGKNINIYVLEMLFNHNLLLYLLFHSDEIKTELGKKLKEHLDDLLDKIRDAIEKGKGVKEETLEKVRIIP